MVRNILHIHCTRHAGYLTRHERIAAGRAIVERLGAIIDRPLKRVFVGRVRASSVVSLHSLFGRPLKSSSYCSANTTPRIHPIEYRSSLRPTCFLLPTSSNYFFFSGIFRQDVKSSSHSDESAGRLKGFPVDVRQRISAI